MTIPAAADWRVTSLRLTVFPVMPQRDIPTSVWEQVLGGTPETVTKRATPAQVEEAGQFKELGKLRFVAGPLRSDMLLNATPTMTPQLDVIGGLTDALDAFLAAGRSWLTLPSTPALQRIALGGVLFQPNDTVAESQTRLASYLENTLRPGFQIPPEFLLQFNSPVASEGIPDLVLNRLSKWQIFFSTVQTMLPAGPSGSVGYATGCELDINTVATHTSPLAAETVRQLLGELAAHFMRVAELGDKA